MDANLKQIMIDWAEAANPPEDLIVDLAAAGYVIVEASPRMIGAALETSQLEADIDKLIAERQGWLDLIGRLQAQLERANDPTQ